MFHILSAVAEIESNLISERTKAGLAAMRERIGDSGAGLGRPARFSGVQRIHRGLFIRGPSRKHTNPWTTSNTD